MQQILRRPRLSGLTRCLSFCNHTPTGLFRPQKQPLLFPNTTNVHGSRTFTASTILLKKKEKSRGSSVADSQTISAKTEIATEDPYDLSSLQAGISTAVSRLRDDLSKLRIGGRFNTESLENLRVCLSKGNKDTLRLGDLAQVVPKGGRMVTILASEEEHIKPVTSAIVSSNLSLTPQPDAHNTLQLNITIPPPTKELREQTVTIAKAAMDKASGAIRESRSVAHKRLQDMQKKKIARPDDVRKAQDQMEKLTEKGQKEVKDLFDTTRKALERSQ